MGCDANERYASSEALKKKTAKNRSEHVLRVN